MTHPDKIVPPPAHYLAEAKRIVAAVGEAYCTIQERDYGQTIGVTFRHTPTDPNAEGAYLIRMDRHDGKLSGVYYRTPDGIEELIERWTAMRDNGPGYDHDEAVFARQPEET